MREFAAEILEQLDCQFPSFRYKHLGVSGTALLRDALRQSGRTNVILPAFICPEISMMILGLNKRLLHIDVDPKSLHIRRELLEDCLGGLNQADAVLLIDHAFGYPFGDIQEIRKNYPRLLIIEDCVRALGAQIHGTKVGQTGDWVLLSMYKTIPGSECGAVLMTRESMSYSVGGEASICFRQIAARMPPARWLFERVKRYRARYSPSCIYKSNYQISLRHGVPDRLSQKFFLQELVSLDDLLVKRKLAVHTIKACLVNCDGVELIMEKNSLSTAASHVSFLVSNEEVRNNGMTRLHRKGVFLVRAWDLVPCFILPLKDTFPYGSASSESLAKRVVHVPIAQNSQPRKVQKLVTALREVWG